MCAKVSISKFNPQMDRVPHYEEYEYELKKGMTVLDVLNCIRDNVDSTLSFSYCCRNGHCGLCAMNINKEPALACRIAASDSMLLEPLNNLPVLRDLIIDRDAYEKLRPKLRLFLERECKAREEPEKIDMDSYEDFKIASRCIECYSCISACPVYKKNPHAFAGPAAFVLEARHIFDCRDELNRQLLIESEGIENCIGCGLCSKACMVGAFPCETIGKLKGLVKQCKKSPN
ncbi:MAG: succinate dehydrogenase/fumarate reductase iron-sulfur subunit [Lawsonibacter sp.]